MNQQESQKIDAYRRASNYPAAGQLLFNFMPFQAGQLAETHLNDCLRLQLIKAKAFHQPLTALRLILGRTQDCNHFIDKIKCNQQTF